MKTQNILIVIARIFHLIPVLIAHAVINRLQRHRRQKLGQRIFHRSLITVPREKHARVVFLLNQRVRCIAVSPDRSAAHRAVRITDFMWCAHGDAASRDGSSVDGVEVVDFEGYVYGDEELVYTMRCMENVQVKIEGTVKVSQGKVRTFNSITMSLLMLMNLSKQFFLFSRERIRWMFERAERRRQDKGHVAVANDM